MLLNKLLLAFDEQTSFLLIMLLNKLLIFHFLLKIFFTKKTHSSPLINQMAYSLLEYYFGIY